MIAATTTYMEREKKISNWFVEYGKRLVRFVRSKTNDVNEAEDIAQEVWYQLGKIENLDGIEQISNWLFHAARNRIINFYRKPKNVAFSQLSGYQNNNDENEPNENLMFDKWAEQTLPNDLLESEEFWDILKNTLKQMPTEQREVFVQNELNDVSFKEMSEKTGVPINTLLARKRYAVLQLRKSFEQLL